MAYFWKKIASMLRVLPGVLFLLVVLSACKSSKIPKLEREFTEMATEQESILFLPLRVDVAALRSSLDRELSGLLSEGEAFTDGDLTVVASKLGELELEVADRTISYGLPLALDITYDVGISRVGARGDIDLDFKTDFFFDEDWELRTETTLTDYRWLRKPSLKLGGVSLPLGALGNLILKFGRNQIARTIDEQVKQNVPLRQWVEDAWQMMRDPILLDETYRAWLLVHPQDFAMSPFRLEEGQWGFTLRARAQPEVSVGEKPASPDSGEALPLLQRFYPEEGQDYFTIFIRGAIPYAEAEALARSELLGETFSAGKRSVTVNDLTLSGRNGLLQVEMDLSGSYEGTIQVEGRPTYNTQRQKLEFKDLDYSMQTRNLLFKSAGWLLKSALKGRLQKELNAYLDSGLTDWKAMLEEQLRQTELGPGLRLASAVRELRILRAEALAEGFEATVGVSGKLAVEVRGL